MRIAAAYVIGLIFGLGIAISGMANPAKVLNFFDLAGSWDPSLAFVMGGALIVTFAGYRFVLRRPRPIIEDRFQIPHNRNIDMRLIGGSALFGIGWGISGFCPGGVLPVLGTGQSEVILFVLALVAGILAAQAITRISQSRRAAFLVH
jgi:uncharacterized membrane protein YedE/YeeE